MFSQTLVQIASQILAVVSLSFALLHDVISSFKKRAAEDNCTVHIQEVCTISD